MWWFIFFLLLAIAFWAYILSRKLPPENYNPWSHLIDGMQYSTKQFYDQVEQAITKHNIEKVTYSRVMLSERGLFSSEREYLRITWRNLTHDIGAFPFGGGFYIASWQYTRMTLAEAMLMKIPLFGPALRQLFFPVSYYTIDTTSMYLTYFHHSLMSVVDSLTKEQGLRSLSEAERKPQLENIFKRK